MRLIHRYVTSVKLIHTSVTCTTVRLIHRYECEAHSHLSYYCEVHSQLRYESEAHSHLSYYSYVMGVKLIRILNYECECVRMRALYFIHMYLCGDG